MLKQIALGISMLFAYPAFGQTTAGPAYPTKPVRIILGAPPGGGVDIVARIFAQRLTDSLGQSFIIENRPGGGMTLAAGVIAKSTPDGYWLLVTSVTHSINATSYSKLSYDTIKDFAPITPISLLADVIAVHPSVPLKTARELISLAKANPGKVEYAHAGNGTMMHVGMELFISMAGIKMLAVPYNGAAQSTLAVLGGQLPVLSTSLPPALPHAKSGRLRILAVTTAQRTPIAPEYPTVEEAAGLKGYEAAVWVGLLAPAGTPPAVINLLNAEIERLQQSRELREQLALQGSDPYRETPAGFGEVIRKDIEKWGKVVRALGLVQ